MKLTGERLMPVETKDDREETVRSNGDAVQSAPDELERLRAENERWAEACEQLAWQLEDIKTSFGFKLLSRVFWPLGGKLVPGLVRARMKSVPCMKSVLPPWIQKRPRRPMSRSWSSA